MGYISFVTYSVPCINFPGSLGPFPVNLSWFTAQDRFPPRPGLWRALCEAVFLPICPVTLFSVGKDGNSAQWAGVSLKQGGDAAFGSMDVVSPRDFRVAFLPPSTLVPCSLLLALYLLLLSVSLSPGFSLQSMGSRAHRLSSCGIRA